MKEFITLPAIEGKLSDQAQPFGAERFRDLIAHGSMNVYYNVMISDDGAFSLIERPTTSARAQLMYPLFKSLLDKLGADASIIDLACSPGYFMFKLAQMGFRNVTGVDARKVHQEQFELQNSYFGFKGVNFVLSDMYEFIEAEISRGKQYDICLLFGFLYHTPMPVELLRNIRKICNNCLIVDTTLSYKEDSSLLVREENTSWSRASTTKINMMPSLMSIPKLFEAAGFAMSERLIPDAELKALNPGGSNIDYYFDQGTLGKLPAFSRRVLHKLREKLSNKKIPDRRAIFCAYPGKDVLTA